MINGKIEISDALLSLVPRDETHGKAQFTYKDNDLKQLHWIDARPRPTDNEIEAEITRLQADYDALNYTRKRQKEYPSVQDLVVALYDTEDKTAIDAKRAEIKLKYPKPVA